MNGWAIFVTVWICISTVVSVAKYPKISKLKGESSAQLSGALAGLAMRGLLMIFSLYMAGLYS